MHRGVRYLIPLSIALVGGAALIMRADDSSPATSDPANEASAPAHSAPATPALVASSPRITSARIALDETGSSLDSDELARRPTELIASNRRAWRLRDLVELPAGGALHAHTTDGGDYALTEDALVVRRDNGELYISWLIKGADLRRPLADIERPAERIEQVRRISIVKPTVAKFTAPSTMAIVIDGEPVRTLTPASFHAAPRITIKDKRPTQAIDVERTFGRRARLISWESDGMHVNAAPPARDARAVVYLTRRGQFNLAWVDASGATIGIKQRAVTQLALRTR